MANDLISRAAAIELCDWYEHEYSEVESYFQKFNVELKELPSVEPERKMGKWIDGFCSECGEEAVTEWNDCGGELLLTRFCSSCGAKMGK